MNTYAADNKEDLWRLYHELFDQLYSVDEKKIFDAAVFSKSKQVVSAIAHDIKNPLTSVKLYADILLSHADEPDVDNCSKYLASISMEAERISSMIANIIDNQNIMNGDMVWHDEYVDVMEVVNRSIKSVRRWCAAKGIGFSYTANIENLVTLMDAGRFSRLLQVLLVNALRFTEKGCVRLDVQSDGVSVVLSVIDNGPGIPEQRLLPFFQSDAVGVTGCKNIGMAFVRTVVEYYRGRVWATSIMGEGSVFYVELPIPSGVVCVQK